jgi:hypothetical protein
MADNDKSIKSFWQRPEGKLGMPVLLGLLTVGGFFLYKALPTIIELMQNTLTAIGLGLGIFAILAILMNDRFRSTVWYLYKGLMRWFTGIVIELNPIAILESYVEDIKEKIVKMEEQLTGLKGQIGKINIKLTKSRTDWKMEMDRATQAKKMGKDAEVALHTRQAGRLEGYINNMDALYKKMEVLYKVLDKMKYYSEIMVKDTEMTVEIKKEEREAITKSHSVMKSAMSIIKGNDDKKVIFDQAMEFVVDDIGFKVGEMERMLEASTDFINSVDLDNAVYEERGMQMLEDFDKKGMDAIFGSKSQSSLPQGTVYNNLNNFSTPTPQPINHSSENSGEKKKYF